MKKQGRKESSINNKQKNKILLYSILVILILVIGIFVFYSRERLVLFESGDCYCNSCESCTSKLDNVLCGAVYLTENITQNTEGCITTQHNKTFDCQGNSISFIGLSIPISAIGIYAIGTNVTINNCNIFGFQSGIYVYYSPHVYPNRFLTIQNTKINSGYMGIDIVGEGNLTLRNVEVTNQRGEGIKILDSPGAVLSNVRSCNNGLLSGGGTNYYDIRTNPNIITSTGDVYCDISSGFICDYSCNGGNFDSNSRSNEWKMYGRDLNHTFWDGISFPRAVGSAEFIAKGNISFTPIVANGYVYVTSFFPNFSWDWETNTSTSEAYVYQLNASNISQLISIYTINGSVYLPLIAAGEYVYTGGYIKSLYSTPEHPNLIVFGPSSSIYQLNASNVSQLISTYTTSDSFFSGYPIVVDGIFNIIKSSQRDSAFMQLNASNISQLISFVPYSPSYDFYSPSNYNFSQFEIAGFSQETAQSFFFGSTLSEISNGYIYKGGSTFVSQFNLSNSSQLISKFTSQDTTFDVPTISNGYVYAGNNGAWGFLKLNASNVSQVVSEFKNDPYNYHERFYSPAIANGFAYIMEPRLIEEGHYNSNGWFIVDNSSYDGILHQFYVSKINAKQRIAKLSVGRTFYPPSVANGYVYVGTERGVVYQLNANNISDTRLIRIPLRPSINLNLVSYDLYNSATGESTMMEPPRGELTANVIASSEINFSVVKGEFFEIQLNVTCLNSDCEHIEVFLDPEKQISLFERFINWIKSLFRGEPSLEPKTKGLISNITGIQPFYTNGSNPQVISLSAGQSYIASFWVNATGEPGEYEFFAFANLSTDQEVSNITKRWNVVVTSLQDLVYPKFYDYYDNNATLIGGGLANFIITILNTNGSVWFEINGLNYTSSSFSSNRWGYYLTLLNGTYRYRWGAYGNGTNHNINYSIWRSYTVNDSLRPLVSNISLYLNGFTTNLKINNGTQSNATCYGIDASDLVLTRDGIQKDSGVRELNEITILPEGYYNYTCTYLGELDYSSKTKTLFLNVTSKDISSPIVRLISPIVGYSTTETTLGFSFNVSDSSRISECSLLINGNVIKNQTAVNLTGINIISATLTVGTYSWSVSCTDSFGNSGSSSSNLVINSVVIPSDPPSHGGGGGSSRRTTVTRCIPDWSCSWTECVNNIKRYSCYDRNGCNNLSGKPYAQTIDCVIDLGGGDSNTEGDGSEESESFNLDDIKSFFSNLYEDKEKRTIILWVIGSLIVLVAVLIGIKSYKGIKKKKIFEVNQKKLDEARKLVADWRAQGYSDLIIIQMFLEKGWKDEIVNKVMKGY